MKLKSFLAKILLLLTIAPQLCFAQSPKIDSLKSLLPLRTGGEYVDILFELGRAYDGTNNEGLFKYSSQAFSLAMKLGDTARIVKCGRLKAQAFRHLGVMDSAEFLLKDILAVAQRHHFLAEQKTILNSMATVYLQTAEYDKALRLYFRTLVLAELDNDKFREGVILNNIGLVYFNLRDFQSALLYWKRSLVVAEHPKARHHLTSTLINISLCLVAQDSLIEAQNYINQVLRACGENCSQETLAYIHSVQGFLFYKNIELGKAQRELDKSNTLAAVFVNDKRLVLENLSYLLAIAIKNKQAADTEKYLTQIEELIATGTPYNSELIQVYAQLCSFYLESKNFEKAALCQNKYINLKDSIYNKELTVNLMRVQSEHLEKENTEKIEAQNRILFLNEEIISRQYYINIFIALISTLLIVVIALLTKINRRKQKINLLLDKKVQQRTRELEINRDALQRACDERDIIIQKTATDIKTSLVTIKGLCAVGLKDTKDPNACEYLTRVDITSDNLSAILRNLFFVNKTRISS